MRTDKYDRTVAGLMADYERNGLPWEGCNDPLCPDWALSADPDALWFTHHHVTESAEGVADPRAETDR